MILFNISAIKAADVHLENERQLPLFLIVPVFKEIKKFHVLFLFGNKFLHLVVKGIKGPVNFIVIISV